MGIEQNGDGEEMAEEEVRHVTRALEGEGLRALEELNLTYDGFRAVFGALMNGACQQLKRLELSHSIMYDTDALAEALESGLPDKADVL